MGRVALAMVCILTLISGQVQAQMMFIGPGSTAQGDYLRGVGFAGFGMGAYNERTAIANAINLNTSIRLNEYIYNCLMHENQMNAEHRQAMKQKHKEGYDKIKERIDQNPEAHDVRKGDALNHLLRELNNPKIQETTSRQNAVPLSVDEVRRIPFKLGEHGVDHFSVARLTSKGKGKWPNAFQDNRFNNDRRAFEKVLDEALEQQYNNNVQIASIEAVNKAIDNLEYTLIKVLGKSSDKLYIEAREKVKDMRKTAEMLKLQKVREALGDLERYAGTTVDDLRVFMLSHNLQFADADTPEERVLFPELYTKLSEQKDRVSQGLAVQDDGPKVRDGGFAQ